MKLIAHRGLYKGPDKILENSPAQITRALQEGYDAEIDVRFINGEWYLGHDEATYPIAYSFLEQPGLWIHAKNLEALYILGADAKLNFFWHQGDDFTLTSQGYIWTYPEKSLTPNSIMLMPEWNDPEFKNVSATDCYAICSDYVETLKTITNSQN